MRKKTLQVFIVFIAIIVFQLLPNTLYSQFKVDLFSSLGKNYNSNGTFINLGQASEYNFNNIYINYGLELNLMDRDKKIVSGMFGSAAYGFQLANTPVRASVFYIWRPISFLINERNWGIKFQARKKHWEYQIGNNFQSYKFNKNSIDALSIDEEDATLKEAWNLMYSVKYYLKEADNNWNASIELTNIDVFIIQKEINPMMNIGFSYQLPEKATTLYTKLWYETAGLNNIRVNYYGFFFNLGVLWQIN